MNAYDFKVQILELFYRDVHAREPDNFAHLRFNLDGVDRSEIFDVAQHARSMEWFNSQAQGLFLAWSRLTDAVSRELYVDLLRYRLAGHLHFKIRSRIPLLKEAAEAFRNTYVGRPSELESSGLLGSLVHYDLDWNGHHYTIDTSKDGLVFALVYRQYYYDRDGIVIAPEAGDHVIDGGSFTGDTAIIFSKSVGPQGKVYTFDPVQNHIDICNFNLTMPEFANVRLFERGLSDRNVDAPPIRLAGTHPGFNVGANPAVPLCRIDDLVIRGEIEKIDFIKMDIEGSEMPALAGAISSIHTFRPKLAISLYHRPNDLFEIINYLHDQQLGYAFYLDHYTIHSEETVLYAIAQK